MRLRVALPVIVLFLLTTSMQALLLAQSSGCTGKAAQAQLSSIDPVYVDAMDLARNLIDHGFIVNCVQASKWGHLFDDQEGAALYRTEQGNFHVLFLPKPETFDAIQVVEQRQGDLYLYSFRGTPHSPGRLEGKTDFIRSANLLFLVGGDADNGYGPKRDLPAIIEDAVSRSPNSSDSCPVTKPPLMAFTPPSPYPTEQSEGSFWFGTENLWTILPMDGTWRGLPIWNSAEIAESSSARGYEPTDSAFRNKLFWWHEGFDWRTEDVPLKVTGRRLDAPAPPLITEHANNGWTNDSHHPFMVAGIFIPTLGCWQITGDYKGERLTFIVLVTQ